MPAGPAILVEDLTKVYRTAGREVLAADRISFDVQPNEVIGLLGPNGGRITVDGFDTLSSPNAVVARVAAVLEGNRNLRWDLTAKQNLEFYAALQGHSRRSVQGLIDELLERFGLAAKRDTETGKLSRGMQQKLALAAALVRQTPMLILDEPTLGLDVDASHEIRAYLRELAAEGRTIVLSSHDLSVVQELCDRVVVIAHGHVVTQDRVANLLRLFRSRAYRFTVRGLESAAARARLTDRFATSTFVPEGDETTVELRIDDPAELYDVMDLLRSLQVSVERMESLDPDLEEVYVRLLRGGGDAVASLAAGAGAGPD